MSKVKVGVVEDEMIIALGIINALRDLGYEATDPANNYTQALAMIAHEKPDILLLDIHLSGHKDGIDLARTIRKEFSIPIIFLTANADAATVERAKETMPDAYLLKPFREKELFTSIELCLSNFSKKKKDATSSGEGHYKINDSLFIKQGQHFHKVKLEDILYIEADNIYLNVYTQSAKMLVRSTLHDYMTIIGSQNFFRVHRSYAVNIPHIQSINSECLIINNKEIPIAKAYREELFSFLKLG